MSGKTNLSESYIRPVLTSTRINVDAVINNVNGNAANWAVGLNEVTVYGA